MLLLRTDMSVNEIIIKVKGVSTRERLGTRLGTLRVSKTSLPIARMAPCEVFPFKIQEKLLPSRWRYVLVALVWTTLFKCFIYRMRPDFISFILVGGLRLPKLPPWLRLTLSFTVHRTENKALKKDKIGYILTYLLEHFQVKTVIKETSVDYIQF